VDKRVYFPSGEVSEPLVVSRFKLISHSQKTTFMKNKILSAAIVGGILLFSACEKESQYNDPGAQHGSMDVNMTDAPANYDVLLVALTDVQVYQQGKGWVALNANAESFNVLELNNGKSKKIAQSSSLEAGVYTKVKLVFNQSVSLTTLASIGLFGNQAAGIFVLQWQGNNTIEVEINEEVKAGEHAAVMLDFDAAKSVVQDAGNYYIRPVIRYIKDFDSGIDGQLEGSAQGMVMVNNGNGEVQASAAFASNGSFKFQGLKSGTYQVNIDYLTEVNGEIEYRRRTIDGVIVADGQMTHMGMISLQ
jgi:hypothetical protein